jgi:hypothetical protein
MEIVRRNNACANFVIYVLNDNSKQSDYVVALPVADVTGVTCY